MNVGLVIDWDFHKANKWVSALTPYLVDALIAEFDPVIISTQADYESLKTGLSHIISLEPGWAAPHINYDTTPTTKKAVFYSDPHYETKKRWEYFDKNGFNMVFSYYYHPFFYHFKDFDESKFLHLPWAIPDQYISDHDLSVRNDEVVIFGGKNSEAYDVRNWCREQKGITNFDNSGVENKKMTDQEYFSWLSQFDAIVAAGSSDPKYDLVTPKYFEIASAGALLIGQYCKDIEVLGFNEHNSLIFTQENFNELIAKYRSQPEDFLSIRTSGRELIQKKHKISDRINRIKEKFINEK